MARNALKVNFPTVVAMYKCRLCGEKFTVPVEGVKWDTARGTIEDDFIYPPENDVHDCDARHGNFDALSGIGDYLGMGVLYER